MIEITTKITCDGCKRTIREEEPVYALRCSTFSTDGEGRPRRSPDAWEPERHYHEECLSDLGSQLFMKKMMLNALGAQASTVAKQK